MAMKKDKIFIVILKYIVEIDKINEYRQAHLKYLDQCYKQQVFLASGPQNPRFGGVIFAKADSRAKLYKILEQDPFWQYLCAEYQVTEFAPNKASKGFKNFLQLEEINFYE